MRRQSPVGRRNIRRPPPEVVPIGPAEVNVAADAVALGFQENSVWVWLLPGDRTRARVERRTYRSLIRHIFVPRRSGWTTTDGTGAALWYPPGTTALGVREKLADALPFLPEGLPRILDASRLQRLIASHWPDEPHWYLSVLSVVPESQGEGHGSALIRPGLERADADRLGAWLETQDEDNVGFYRRFGFELVRQIEVAPGLPLWLMWRPPAG